MSKDTKKTLPEIDLVNRDPNNLNGYIQVGFNDAFGEPEDIHTGDCVWRNSYKCFTCSMNLCYKILTYIFGIIIAFFWGCGYAIVAFECIWFVAPAIRILHICLTPIKKIFQMVLSTFLGPLFEAMGLLFSRINVTQSQGPPPKPFGEFDDAKSAKK